ncbi:hypothetical protein FACS1894198_2070 [Clostridia bacterium]|nr:hypothetical protein FACS1894198_2070 [Clostridia bacterium]
MKFDPKSYWQKALDFWNAQDKKKKIIYVSSAGGVLLAVILGSVALSSSSANVDLYKDLPPAQVSKVLTTLQSVGINANLEDGSRVTVPKKDQAKATMQLALAGFPKVPYGYDLFKGNSSLLSSESDKKTCFCGKRTIGCKLRYVN